ncbi:endonuclease/exonuclease/phosphatase family protein [Sansalvadorimonas sp. 2012CJ34-2]|uniref:Endonuclease/exonuclease/phosphatase family protein n=1 Tax=Parendozoicomonas callyspongiae TaxID=2942213 RepID=A0ABT0PBR3_9GAMM|nr:endonuclease/exonuclease/phosphatase family protein [Sansalvadorimonas sp. 2012CJ34-2]MCL6268466.1 endonuclease/exonuclease/phosphatase family protein [Sansalvadorimonas sp. 2012CJ34-2]
MPLKAVQRVINRRLLEKGFTRQRMASTALYGERDDASLRQLRLLSFNIQVGITTQQYGHYVTRGWQHFLPSLERQRNLDRIARLIHNYDIVAIQEADGGSLRTGFVNQIEYLAHRAGFPWWYQQLNRNLGRLAQHSNGLLTRFHPENLEDHKLPGLIPGRGAIVVELGTGNPILLVVMHLALSRRGRNMQLEYVRKLSENYEHVVLMGDMNAHADQLLTDSPLASMGLHSASKDVNTFPSWKPSKSLDHILLSSDLHAQSFSVVDFPQSDHLPVAVQIELPQGVDINRRAPTTH